MIGQTISHYRILEKLGGGGMGVVYKAEDTRLKRTVALKFLPPDLTRDEEAKQRFIHEAQAASSLDHPNICDIHDIGETDDGQLFIVMTCYEGETLKKKIERGPLAVDEAVNIAFQVAQGLAKAHDHKIIHRDIKPANIMITADGTAKIVDFGLAKLAGGSLATKSGSTMGTAAYMSPEQVTGQPVDCRTDIWSLGVVLYEMLAAKRPFACEFEQSTVYAILNEDPGPMRQAQVPDPLERICRRAMAKDPKDRYQTVAEFISDVESYREGTQLSKRTRRMAGRKRSVLRASAAITMVIAAIAAIILSANRSEKIDSIAVLPFENLSKDSTLDFYSDGLTDELITRLYSVGNLSVRSTRTMMQFKNTRKTPREIARELNVKALLTGTVMRSGDRVRLSFQLTDASGEKNIWGDSYEESSADVLVVIGSVSQAVVREVKVKLSPQEQTLLASSPKVDPRALDFYLKGRAHWNRRSAHDLRIAITYFNQAIERDTTYAEAYAGLASAYLVLPEYAQTPQSEAMPKVKAFAMKALELDATLAEPYAVLGLMKEFYEWDGKGAEMDFKKAIELNPGLPIAHHWYSVYLWDHGRLDEALTESKRAQDLDPTSLIINSHIGDVLYSMRQYDKALEQYKKTLAIDPNYAGVLMYVGLVYDLKGQFSEAIAVLEKERVIVGDSPYALSCLGHAYARAGRTSDAMRVLDELARFMQQGYSVSYDIALVYNGLGDKDKTFEWLEKAYQERHALLCRMNADPIWDKFRSDPRFIALVKKIGMEQ